MYGLSTLEVNPRPKPPMPSPPISQFLSLAVFA
jgi:hypothetical protein